MTGAHEPDRDGSADDSAADAHDAVWDAIVANYGDRVELDDDLDPREEVPGSPRGLFAVEEPAPRPRETAHEEHFVPPPPPPIPRAEPARLIAWVGLFGVPLAVLVAVVTGLSLSDWLGLILMVWFVGGFVYLVASMRSGPRDDTDDGAVL